MKNKPSKKYHPIYLLLIGMFMVSLPITTAGIIDMEQGSTSKVDSIILRVKKVNEEDGWCKIKLNALKDQKIMKGASLVISGHIVSVSDVQKERCILLIKSTQEEYDIVDILARDSDGIIQRKEYEVKGKKFTLEIGDMDNNKASFILTWPSQAQEKTFMLESGGLFVFSDSSEINLLKIEGATKIQFGMRITPPPQFPPESTPQSLSKHPKDMNEQQKEDIIEEQEKTKEDYMQLENKENQQGETEEKPKEKENSEKNQELHQEKNPESPCAQKECYLNSEFHKCVTWRTRLIIDDTPMYCDSDGTMRKQKDAGEPAQESYECISNVMKKEKCLPVRKKVSFFNRIASAFFHILG